MNNLKKYRSFDQFILRTPYLSFDEISNLNIEKVKKLCKSKAISNAIYLASPELHSEMVKFIEGSKDTYNKKLINTLLKYLTRMGTRCTPFGLFAGCSIGYLSKSTNIKLNNSSQYKRITRLDMNYLCALSQKLELDKEIRKNLLFYPNSSLYSIGNEMRYVEYRYMGTERKHFLVSIDSSPFLDKIFNLSNNGESITVLARSITDDEISIDDATDFIHELIDNQILISSISPSITGKDYFETLRNKIKNQPLEKVFKKIKNKIDKLDSYNNDSLHLYNEITELTSSLGVNVNKKYLLQTDLIVTHKDNVLSYDIVKDVKEGLRLLNKMSFKRENKKLTYFKKKFIERFEEEEVSLAIALDVETGIGFGEEYEDADSYSISDLSDDITIFNRADGVNEIINEERTKSDLIVQEKLLKCFHQNEKIVKLNLEDFNDFDENWEDIPKTFSAFIKVFEVNESKPLIHLSEIGGTTAAYLLGRFGHTDLNINNFIEDILDKEKDDDYIYAEIVHLPEARVGNILSRANIREYEIPYLAKSLLPKENQLLITDIFISIKDNEIVLRSKEKNKRIIPMLTNAHNYQMNALPIYEFLAVLQSQNKREHIGFQWEDSLSNQPYLPRVMYKNLVFSLATWNLNKEKIKELKSLEDLYDWKKKMEIPNKIIVSDFDNELYIDFDNELSCNLFLSLIKKRENVILKEYLFNNEKPLIKKDGSSVNNEIILSFYKDEV